MLFSIIVPIYNVEKYLDRCLESLVNQSFDNYEIILVDDQSTDNSLTIAEKWERDNSHIKLICKKGNTGLSDTRNVGLKKAIGDYIIFVDSDDYVEKDCLVRLENELHCFNYPDIIYCAIIGEINKNSYYLDYYSGQCNIVTSPHDFLLMDLREKRRFYAAAWSAVFKRSLIEKSGVYFKNGLIYEEELWSPQILMNAKKVCHIDYAFYHYVKRPGSITTSKDKTKNGLDLISTCNELMTFFSNYYCNDKEFEKRIRNHISIVYMRASIIGRLYRKEYRKCIDRFFPIKNVCTIPEILKAILFLISPKLHYVIGASYEELARLKGEFM